MQSSQSDISFVKDIFNNSKNIIKSCLKILELTENFNESINKTIPYNFGEEFMNYVSNVKVSKRQSFILKDEVEIEKEFERINLSLKKCHKKEFLDLELKTIQLNLDKTKYNSIFNVFNNEYQSLHILINKLIKKWEKVFDKCIWDFEKLHKTLFAFNQFYNSSEYIENEFYIILVKIHSVMQYESDVLDSIGSFWITPIKEGLDNEKDSSIPMPKFEVEEEDPNNSRTLNSILILLDKFGFFNLPKVENLGENKKGKLIAFLTKYKESTCKVTIKEMSESPSAEGRNNPYNTQKAIKNANDFLTKLNS